MQENILRLRGISDIKNLKKCIRNNWLLEKFSYSIIYSIFIYLNNAVVRMYKGIEDLVVYKLSYKKRPVFILVRRHHHKIMYLLLWKICRVLSMKLPFKDTYI